MLKNYQSSYLNAGNAAYLETLYEQYLDDPATVPSVWQDYFSNLPGAQAGALSDCSHAKIRQWFLHHIKEQSTHRTVSTAAPTESVDIKRCLAVDHLVKAYRAYGHTLAQCDPLGLSSSMPLPQLELSYHGLTDQDLTATVTTDVPGCSSVTLQHLINQLQKIYGQTLSLECDFLEDPQQIAWLRERFEAPQRAVISPEEQQRILKLVVAAETFEDYLGVRFVGQKRFSLQGGCALIPALSRSIEIATQRGAREVLMGMAHRGRLNVMVNILGYPVQDLLDEFEGKKDFGAVSGDVKYHNGYSSDVMTTQGPVHLMLAFNPSHLEAVYPVLLGSTRCRLDHYYQGDEGFVLPIIIHGDAALSGQGVVMEALNMSQTRAHYVGGAVHFVVNNQIGFTTSELHDARSSRYCTDIAKMIGAPVLRVNADDVESVCWAAQLAVDYRYTFKRDIFVDLMCYRRFGHNEADEPALTQPLMYQVIRQHSNLCDLYMQKLQLQGVDDVNSAKTLAETFQKDLDQGHSRCVEPAQTDTSTLICERWSDFIKQPDAWDSPVDTTYDEQALIHLGADLLRIPEGFTLHRVAANTLKNRQAMLDARDHLDWGHAENLAYATLIDQGVPIRLVGEDCERGTFAHRQAVLHDQKTGKHYIPLQCIASSHQKSNQTASFQVYNSLLSEEAVLGFEYGYAMTDPKPLVIWEAQYGDFANGAQIVIDQFISSGWQKWQRLCGLVMLLPHGYEGSGPEHSSARLERYLQLCAQNNLQVCVPSTPAQIFHLLRRQALRCYRRPLIVMTPKNMLRHRSVTSSIADCAQGCFHTVLADEQSPPARKVKRVVLCSGKVYYDLLACRGKMKTSKVALLRLEQLYPFPDQALSAALKPYAHVKDIVWCQEEPRNQGSWYSTHHRIQEVLHPKQQLSYAGRVASAAPATGSASLHRNQQEKLINEALGFGPPMVSKVE